MKARKSFYSKVFTPSTFSYFCFEMTLCTLKLKSLPKVLLGKICHSIKSEKLSLPLIKRTKKIRSTAKGKTQLFNTHSKVDNKVAFRRFGELRFFVKGSKRGRSGNVFIFTTKQRMLRSMCLLHILFKNESFLPWQLSDMNGKFFFFPSLHFPHMTMKKHLIRW